MPVPEIRVSVKGEAPVRPERDYVLYWMIAARRTCYNFALDRAVAAAIELRRPLVVLEAIRCDYRWASDRAHRFVLDGMADNARAFAAAHVVYHPYVEQHPGAGAGLVETAARKACIVVTDDFPCFFLPRMVDAAARRIDVRLEAVDSNGLAPLRDADRVFPTAYAFRRHLQKSLPRHLDAFPSAEPLAAEGLARGGGVPAEVSLRWPAASAELLDGDSSGLAFLPVDHAVAPVSGIHGGEVAGRARLDAFAGGALARYAVERNDPDKDVASRLSPYLHFGHLSIHEVFAAIAAGEGWTRSDLATTATGKRSGFWGMSGPAEAFLDQAVTWRELGYNLTSHRDDYDRFESLPDWARGTLARHAADPRDPVYDLETFREARTHDPLWNAAQRQLVREGRIHSYLRMLWGKKILQWSRGPEEALDVMIELNNRYALDGRNPNSYSGIFWVLGRYDRPWGPERPIFGTVRYMSSENTARKLSVKRYLARYGSIG
jgi:deoxyribodipyrimidine photo-lyase